MKARKIRNAPAPATVNRTARIRSLIGHGFDFGQPLSVVVHAGLGILQHRCGPDPLAGHTLGIPTNTVAAAVAEAGGSPRHWASSNSRRSSNSTCLRTSCSTWAIAPFIVFSVVSH